MARIAGALGTESAASGIFELNDTLGIAPTLEALGIPEAELDEAAGIIADAEIPNPRPVTRDVIRQVIGNAFHGRRETG
jgi:maleylacetate reductase